MNVVMPCVNRTWVHDSFIDGKILDENQCEHVVDKFWLLDAAQVNCKGEYTSKTLPDGGATVDGEPKGYGTSRFSEIFNETEMFFKNINRSKFYINEDGSEGSFVHWWLRSAYLKRNCQEFYVNNDGYINRFNTNTFFAVTPATLIG